MKKKRIKEPKQNGLTMKQIQGYIKSAKGSKKLYWRVEETLLKVQ